MQASEHVSPQRDKRGAFYGWWMVGSAALVMTLTMVPFFYALPTWFVALDRRFGWTRAQLTWAFALSRAESGLFGPIEGLLVDRFGSRRMVLTGMLIMGGGFLLFSRVQELWHLYLAFIIMSVGFGIGSWLPMMTALNNWFIRRRSFAIALALMSSTIGGVILVPLIAWVIDPEQYGVDRWRTIAAGVGVVLMVMAFPVSRLVRNRPEDYGQRPDGETRPAAPETSDQTAALATSNLTEDSAAPNEGSFTWQEAMRTRAFWLISFGHGCTAIVIVTLMVHLGVMLEARDFSLPMIGLVLSTYIGVGALFHLVGGYVGDRVLIRRAVFGFAITQSVALVVLVLAEDSIALVFLFAVLLGIGYGGRLPLTSAIRGVYFGRRSFASITAISLVPLNILSIAAPQFAAYLYDFTQSYAVPLYTVAAVNLLGSFLFLILGDPKPSTVSPQTTQVRVSRTSSTERYHPH